MDPIYSYGTKFDIWIILFLFNLTHTQTHTDIHTYTYTHIHTYKPRTIIHIHINAMPLHARKTAPFSLSLPYLYFYRSAILYSNSRAKFEYNERLIKTMGLGCIVVDNE